MNGTDLASHRVDVLGISLGLGWSLRTGIQVAIGMTGAAGIINVVIQRSNSAASEMISSANC